MLNLNLFNNLRDITKENNIIHNFMKELKQALENNLGGNVKKDETLVQRILDGGPLTTQYRDKINIERSNIIKNFSKENSDQGDFYYVYSKWSDNTYGAVNCKNGEMGEYIGLKENEFPKGAEVDCVLRVKNGKIELDKNATQQIQEELTQMINKLLKEQENTLEAQRVEGHIYEFIEKAGDMVELHDITKNTGRCFEEPNFPKELANKATTESRFKYENGEYRVI